uniref:Glycine rich superfamily member n=1 Tax=Panagrellus redivivus TaxID=6233 RepID=A0A7E4UXL7_PANRE
MTLRSICWYLPVAGLVLTYLQRASCQINLGTLNFGKNERGDFQLGVGQAANIFGFGGDREFGLTAGNGGFDTKVGGGALIGGERLGLDGGLGVRPESGINLGSMLNFGNGPPNPSDPAGSLNTFINNVGYFFQRFAPPRGGQITGTPLPPVPPELASGRPSQIIGSRSRERISAESRWKSRETTDSPDDYNVEEIPERSESTTEWPEVSTMPHGRWNRPPVPRELELIDD